MVCATYALGGLGSGLCEDEKKLREVASQVFLSRKFIDTLCSRQVTWRISCKRQNLLKTDAHCNEGLNKGEHAFTTALWYSCVRTPAHNHITKAAAAGDMVLRMRMGLVTTEACARMCPPWSQHFHSWEDLFCAFCIGWNLDGLSESPRLSEATCVLLVD